VGGIHLYAAIAPFLLDADYQSKLEQPTAVRKLVQFRHHHLVTWMQYHPPSKKGTHFFGQVRRACCMCQLKCMSPRRSLFLMVWPAETHVQ
jgi:hypothetical protein